VLPPGEPRAVGALDKRKEDSMELTLRPDMFQPLVALLAGILILIVPRILNYVIALYLILIGLLGLFPDLLDNLLR
jgi:hypothetical protein